MLIPFAVLHLLVKFVEKLALTSSLLSAHPLTLFTTSSKCLRVFSRVTFILQTCMISSDFVDSLCVSLVALLSPLQSIQNLSGLAVSFGL